MQIIVLFPLCLSIAIEQDGRHSSIEKMRKKKLLFNCYCNRNRYTHSLFYGIFNCSNKGYSIQFNLSRAGNTHHATVNRVNTKLLCKQCTCIKLNSHKISHEIIKISSNKTNKKMPRQRERERGEKSTNNVILAT